MPKPNAAIGGSSRPGPGNADATPATVTQVIDRVMTRFDGNSDAALTKAEMLAALDPNGKSTTLAARLDTAIAALDTSKDGSVGRVELAAAITALDLNKDGSLQRSELSALKAAAETPAIALFLHAHGGGEGSAPQPKAITALVDLFFTRADADTSGGVSSTELLANGIRGLSTTDAQAKVAALMTAFDSNKDAMLSRAEAAAALTTIDTDKDGSISRAEHAATHDATGTLELVGVLLGGGHHDGGFGC